MLHLASAFVSRKPAISSERMTGILGQTSGRSCRNCSPAQANMLDWVAVFEVDARQHIYIFIAVFDESEVFEGGR